MAAFFDEKQLTGRVYNHGNILAKGVVLPKDRWTFSVVPKLIEKIRAIKSRV